ncbi:MAG: hypothetical protein A2359_04325 [Candidatus Moranbacteria bacterium RIFOXYB1_FULL_43_19]|nr:MAG: hypothetical protein A2359_04325 [Candidatus Moranbacteria bacterium RIFOXYB1_FULL_43_19]OGI32880.1 MAG: hypothetical protein A2420_04480 [Candidatus Moranbacteria bacterium RIFOXYC1_FULL_44_13]OGI37359.1 MAG: hypothetical protein A2612_00610 [Candidatus Moranbacteria bacterium RIFOXYD1_FULL_44_12]
MKKKLLIGVFAAAFAFLAFSGAAMAKKQDIPEKNGVYDVPGKPDMKVRVFVHKVKPFFNGETALPVCNDYDSTSVVKSAGWKLPKGTWDYYVNTADAPDLNGGNFKDITVDSFAQWTIGTDLSGRTDFHYVAPTDQTTYKQDFKNIVTWGPVSNSNTIAVTYTWYNRRTKVVVENDTVMNAALNWSWADYLGKGVCGITGFDAQNILTHELGHWVGLNDHYTSAYQHNTMFGYGSPAEVKKDTLTAGDIAGVNKIY